MDKQILYDKDDILSSAIEGNLFFVQQLIESVIEAQGDISIIDGVLDDRGNTPLLLAYKNNHPSIVDELLLFGCSPDIQNLDGQNLRTLYLQHSGADYIKSVVQSYFIVCEKKERAQIQFGVLLDEFSKEYLGRKVFNLSRYISSRDLDGIDGKVHETGIHLYEEVYGAVKFMDSVFGMTPWESREVELDSSENDFLIISTTDDLALPSQEIHFGENRWDHPRCTQSVYRLYCAHVKNAERLVGRIAINGEEISGVAQLSSDEAGELLSVEYLNEMKKLIFGHELENRN